MNKNENLNKDKLLEHYANLLNNLRLNKVIKKRGYIISLEKYLNSFSKLHNDPNFENMSSLLKNQKSIDCNTNLFLVKELEKAIEKYNLSESSYCNDFFYSLKKTKYLAVFDLEMTCDDKVKIENKIIEIGCVIVDTENFNIIEKFQSFVKPLNPRLRILTEFCKTLCPHISQNDIENADFFSSVGDSFGEFLKKYESLTIIQWGTGDLKHLNCEFLENNITEYYNFFNAINIKDKLSYIYNMQYSGLRRFVNRFNINKNSARHSALADAENTFYVLEYFLKDKGYLK